MRKRAAHFGTFDVRNYGDLLFPLILERRLADLEFDWVHVSPRGGAPVWRDCVPTISVEALLKDPPPLAALVVGGGNIVNFGATTLEDYQRGGLSAVLAYPQLWLEPAFLAQQNRIPILWNAPGVSEPFPPDLVPLVQWAASVPGYLSVRDRSSRTWLEEAGVQSTVHLVPDTALEISRLWPAEKIESAYEDVFARCQQAVPARTIVFHLNDRFVREAPEAMAVRLDRVCARHQATAILLALGPCHGDSELQRRVGERMATRPVVIDEPSSLCELAACLARSEAYVGSSLHGFITACSFGRRAMVVVPRAAATHHKFAGFLEPFHLGSWICDSWEESGEKIDLMLAESPAPWQQVLATATPQLDLHWERVRRLLAGRPETDKPEVGSKGRGGSSRSRGGFPAVGEAFSPPIQQVIQHQASRAAEAVRALREESRKCVQHQKAHERARAELAALEAKLESAREELVGKQERLEAVRRETGSRLSEMGDRLRAAELELSHVEYERRRHRELEARLSTLDRDLAYARLILGIRDAVDAVIGPGATVSVISKGDDELLKLGHRNARHFPGDPRGGYIGYHPANGKEALGFLEAQWMAGSEFLVVPKVYEWWLHHYPELSQHLQGRAACVHQEGNCAIFRLAPRPLLQLGHLLDRAVSTLPKNQPVQTSTEGQANSAGEAGVKTLLEVANALEPMDDAHYLEVVRGVQLAVDRCVPADQVVAVVSKGDDELLRFARHRGWHFPQTEQGVYAGFHPGSDSDAIRLLESMRMTGAAALVIPRTAWWWFDHYRKFGTYLRTRYRCAGGDKFCFVFDLSSTSSLGWLRRAQTPAPDFVDRIDGDEILPAGRDVPSNVSTSVATRPVPSVDPPATPLHANLVTVIVPIYNAIDEVRLCLESLVRHTVHPHQVLLIDDCSSDPAVVPMLNSYVQKHPHFHLRRNPVNRGFTATINVGCREAPGDVVLLNSDTQVTPGWLEKLTACAASRDHVATVTPLSNAAGAFSVPQNNCVNEIPAPLTFVEMGNLVERLSNKIRPAVPTGNGFCMYVTRRALNIVGRFDEENFPRGYGEENDFCMRAIARGFVNLIDDSTFIQHHRGASFQDSRQALVVRASETLHRLHPTYKRDVKQWLTNDPLDGLRAELQERLRLPDSATSFEPGRPCLLYLIHDGSGGTLLTNADLMREMAKDHRCLVLKTALSHWTLVECQDGRFHPVRVYKFSQPWQVQHPLDAERTRVLEDICRHFDVRLVHVRHLLGSGPETVQVIDRLGIPVVVSFHDFYAICPTIQLIDDRGVYCGGRCTPGSGDCTVARSWFRGEVPVIKHQFVHEHRRRMGEAFRHSRCFVTTCESARETLQNVFPVLRDADFRIIEHGRDIERIDVASRPRPGVPAKVVCVGNVDHAKGADLIETLMAINRRSGNRFEFHFVGSRASTFNPAAYGGVCHGKYERDELPGILQRIRPSFSLIASICAETFCHALTESWAAGLPVFASNLGALKERVRRFGGGWLLDPTRADDWYGKMVEVLDSPSAYDKALNEVLAIKSRSVAAMAEDYRNLYAGFGVSRSVQTVCA